ncbi:NAD-dependent epimerase/dehydratase family protein [Pseudorhodoplanes sp.]|uniref:NAD-dependent epimerase/dehydratase family protein n=1 Tax=Pseudorhodoplanes sp. TaxID=1934341 RepID=UPI002B623A9A|nr:NAD-dependent epimerase/dehydratase family protein [Pseudorhodoplanes sp.]HWV42660.1 NAD-dependent epimerase/dehydratase family protein [Pseudorhodoplanes sp.]
MRVLITGASGFVGRALTCSLSRAGYQVRAAARNRGAVPRAEILEIVQLPDLAKPVDWRPLLADVDAVVHLAGIAHISRKLPDTIYDRVNRIATKELALAASLSPNVRRLVFISSIRAQTGPVSDHILTENDPPQPVDAYGRSKLAAEAFVRGYGAPWTILRPVMVYGPEARANFRQLARAAALPLPLPFRGLDKRRSVVALDNLLSAIRFTLEHPATVNQTYIVADPTPISPAEMIAIMREARGRAPGLVRVPQHWIRAGLATIGKRDAWDRIGAPLIADITKLRDAGWVPPTDTPQALADLVRRG